MPERVTDDAVSRLEALAARFYPGQYVLVDEAMDDLLEKQGLRAAIIVSDSPGLRPEVVRNVALVSFRQIGRSGIPESWKETLVASRSHPWKVDIYVPRSDILSVRSAIRQLGCHASVIPLP